MTEVKIRYNTLCDDNHNFWRVLIKNTEHICSNVILEVPCHTTRDVVWDSKRKESVDKHHITCFANEVIWKGDVLIVK
jgi:hypothetical protein